VEHNFQPKEHDYAAIPNILFNEHQVFKPEGVTFDASLFAADEKGNKNIPVGQFIAKITETGLYGPYDIGTELAPKTNGQEKVAGILTYAVDVTDGNNLGNCLIHGFVKTALLPVAPTPAVIAALPLICFL
jgi:hypothetical protein